MNLSIIIIIIKKYLDSIKVFMIDFVKLFCAKKTGRDMMLLSVVFNQDTID